MNNETAPYTKQETLNPRYAQVEAMAYRYRMTVEEYAIALATQSQLPEPRSDEEIFQEIGRELENVKARIGDEGEVARSIGAATAKLGWLRLIQKEDRKFLYLGKVS